MMRMKGCPKMGNDLRIHRDVEVDYGFVMLVTREV